ncbi:MAG: recombinase family protein [Opitutales bacterium]
MNYRFLRNLLSVLAEYERDLIRERTLAGLKAARARGRCGDRPQKMTKLILKVIASEMKDRSVCTKDLCKQYNIGYTCLYNYVTPNGDYTKKGLSLLNR